MLKAIKFPDDAFSKWLIISLVAHFSFVIILGLKTFIFPSKEIIIRNAIRVDMLGLPEKIKETKKPKAPTKKKAAEPPKPEAKKPKAKVKAKPKPKKPAVSLKKEKSDQAAAMEKLKQLSAIDRIKEQQTEVEAPSQTVPNLPEYKGNQIIKGNSFTGVAGLSAQDYFNDAKAHIQSFWALPEWLTNLDLRASVIVELDEDGSVKRAEIRESSGETAFDDAALAAVEAASPFPVPPESIRDTITNSWMIFNFPQ